MRRFRQQLPDCEARHILVTATNGILSLVDPDGRPYGVPMSFVFDGVGALYFHCATEGRKMECLRRCDRASFCAVGLDEIHPEEFTTYFRSVIAEGRIYEIEDPAHKIAALRLLGAKYSPGIDSTREIDKGLDHVAVLRLEIESLNGKEALELACRR